MFQSLTRFFTGSEVPDYDSDTSWSQASSDDKQTATSTDGNVIKEEEQSLEGSFEDFDSPSRNDFAESKEEIPTPEATQTMNEKDDEGTKSKNKRKSTSNMNGKIAESEHLYYCNEDDTCSSICASWSIVGGVDELIRLNSPYHGTKVGKRTKFRAGTALRIDDTVENPGADVLRDEVEEEDDKLCSKCLQGHSPKYNPIMYCDGPDCEIALHKMCANLKRLPRSFLCEPCEHNKFVFKGSRPMDCEGCGSSQAYDPWELRAGRWFHNKCVGYPFVKQKRKCRAKDKCNDPFEDEKPFMLDVEKTLMTNREEVRNDVWTIVMGTKLEGLCPVCGTGLIRKEKGGFDCAHIDCSRKKDDGSISRSDCWNLVPSCSQCNQNCGMRNMFDYMARFSTSRGLIRIIACKKLYCHLVQGYSSENAPSRKDLYNHIDNKGTLDFASFVAESYNTSHIDDSENGLSYRELLYLSGKPEQMFNRIFQSKGMLDRYVPEEWET